MKRNRALMALITLSGLAIASAALAQALPAIMPGAPPQSVHVPMAPTASFVVATAGEFQIDAMGAPMDAQLMLLQDGSTVTQDMDSGDGVDARIVTFLAPGTYGVRVTEWQGRAMSSRLSAIQLPAMTPVATIAPGGPPAMVSAPYGDSARSASVEVTLTIAAAGNYRIDVISPDASVDPEMQLIQNAALVQADSDSGDGTNAQVVRQLTPGNYTIRVRDWINRPATLAVSAAAQ